MTSVALRVRKHRENLRSLGFRLVQMWVPDTRRKGFIEECRRQSKLIKHDKQEKEVLTWIESASDHKGWV